MNRTRAAGIGVFVVAGGLLFTAALFMIGNRRMLFTDTFTLYTEFKSVGGIQAGSSVRVGGMDAGEVKDIEIPTNPGKPFRVKMEVRRDIHGLVRTDSVAAVRTEGLVGAQFLQIVPGTATAPRLPDGGTIAGQEPFDIADLTHQMSETIHLVNSTIVDMRGDLERTILSIDQTAARADALIQDVSGDVTLMTKSGARIVDNVRAVTDDVRAGRGTVGRLFTDDQLAGDMTTMVSDARASLDGLKQVIAQAQQMLQNTSGKGGSIDTWTSTLRATLDKARDAMDNVSSDAEALKRNFFFKGYFNDRGFYNLADLSPGDYLGGALQKNGRHPLRIWLRADLLFTGDPGGDEMLSDEGRRRIDSAMSQFLGHSRKGPLVVEGYAVEPTEAERYLKSRSRAASVRAYLLDRFRLDRTTTGAMALGTARESPTGDGWDGIALALFVDGRPQDKE